MGVLAISISCVALAAAPVWGHGGAHGGGSHRPSGSSKEKQTPLVKPVGDLRLAENMVQARHGGQVSATKWHYFEVVYEPHETRVYVYSPSKRPMSPPRITGEVVMLVNGDERECRYPLQFTAAGATGDAGYLAAAVDLSRVRDGDMQVTFEVANLPFQEERQARFTQRFALTRPPKATTVLRLTEADRPLVTRQGICPVTETPLGEHGPPLKVAVAEQAFYVCCEGCVADVEKAPQAYVRKAAALAERAQQPFERPEAVARQAPDQRANRAPERSLAQYPPPVQASQDSGAPDACCDVQTGGGAFAAADDRPPPEPVLVIADAAPEDEPAIRAQGVCPIMNRPLGAPIKILIDGRPLFVCCRRCAAEVTQRPSFYLARVAPPKTR